MHWLFTGFPLVEAREDPCREGLHDCSGQHMTCAREGNKHRCLCLDGYELIFTNDLDTRGVCVGMKILLSVVAKAHVPWLFSRFK